MIVGDIEHYHGINLLQLYILLGGLPLITYASRGGGDGGVNTDAYKYAGLLKMLQYLKIL